MMNEKIILTVLHDLNKSSQDITASALVSTDGLPIASTFQKGVDSDRVGGMSAALLALVQRAVRELSCGNFQQITVQGDDGYILMFQADREALLVFTAREDARLGMLLHNAKQAVQRLASMKQSGAL